MAGVVIGTEYAEFLAGVGRLDESIVAASRARDLDPLSPAPSHLVAYGYLAQGRYDDAIEEFGRALGKHPNWTWGHIKIARANAYRGTFDDALAHVASAEAQLEGRGTPLARAWLGGTHGMAGNTERALETLATFDRSPDVYVDPLARSYVHAGLGERDRVLDCIEQAYRERSPLCAHMAIVPHLLPELALMKEPRFLAVLERMAYPDWTTGSHVH